VVIDPGHGGHDTGAIGSSGVQEKDVVLSISQYIAPYLQKYGIQTFYTRNKDIYLSLEERTLYANQMRADVFVSVHANSALRKQACGIETYYLNTTSDEYSLRLASLENKGSNKPISALKFILTDLSLQASSQESYRLALQVQKLMVKEAKRIEPKIHDLGVKPSLFYVLLGAKMPAILVETAFISNAQEEKLLTQAAYQRLIAKAIALAIVDYSRASLTIAHPFKQ
jgi:N-acetylmuramoyl-L-alanine amidase